MKWLAWLLAIGTFAPALALAQEGVPPLRAQDRGEVQKTLSDIESTFGFVPEFLKRVSDDALPGAWATVKGIVLNRETAIDNKTKELIGVAVAAQTPSSELLYLQERAARNAGASDAEIREAVAVAALTRNWSTFLNGIDYDPATFRAEADRMLEPKPGQAKKEATVPAGAPKAAASDSPDAVYRDIEQTFGIVPGFLRDYPKAGIIGAWKEIRELELGPTALSPKAKELVGLGVAAQVPCSYCTYFHTRAAVTNGASAEEIREAVALAGVARHWTTLFAAAATDPARFRQDVDRMLEALKAREKASPGGKPERRGEK